MGLLIASWSLLNVLGITDTSSDIFWCIAGLGLVIEGIIELYYEKQDDN
jgi:hypothetical protein